MDQILAEVRRNREELVTECGGDLHSLCEALRGREAEHPDRIKSPASERSDGKRVA